MRNNIGMVFRNTSLVQGEVLLQIFGFWIWFYRDGGLGFRSWVSGCGVWGFGFSGLWFRFLILG